MGVQIRWTPPHEVSVHDGERDILSTPHLDELAEGGHIGAALLGQAGIIEALCWAVLLSLGSSREHEKWGRLVGGKATLGEMRDMLEAGGHLHASVLEHFDRYLVLRNDLVHHLLDRPPSSAELAEGYEVGRGIIDALLVFQSVIHEAITGSPPGGEGSQRGHEIL